MKKILMAMMMAIGSLGIVMAQQERQPEGNWLITGLMVDGNMTDVSDKPFQLEFRSAEGSVGARICNSISGKYSVKGEKIKFGTMMSTKMMCPDMTFESALNKAFTDADRFKFRENKLLLLKGNVILIELTMPV